MDDLRVSVWSNKSVTWIALTQNGALILLVLGSRTNESLKEAALLAKGTGARLFCEDCERVPNSILNAIRQESENN